MKIWFDQHWILSIEHPDIPQLKLYRYIVQGYHFESMDKGLIVLHKKVWKIINLKNLGDGMQIVYGKKTSPLQVNFLNATAQLTNTLSIFQGFDEENGKSYHFLPFFAKLIEEKFSTLKNLSDQISIRKSQNWTFIDNLQATFHFPETLEEQIGFLFWLAWFYGSFEIKNSQLSSVKIHIPLFWQRSALEEKFLGLIQTFQRQGKFMTWSCDPHNSKKIFQIVINDSEILDYFIQLWNYFFSPTEPITFAWAEKHKLLTHSLIDFLKSQWWWTLDGLEETLNAIQDFSLKFLKY